jgi:N-acyl-D-aspartate/D-glutamate deacylase
MHDLLIRGATLVDGLGHDPIRADVAVKDGRITAIETRSARTRPRSSMPAGSR